MGFFKKLFGIKDSEKEEIAVDKKVVDAVQQDDNLLYFIQMDGDVYGPFKLQQILDEFPLTPDTLVTTNTLGGEWYEAECFECFDSLFDTTPKFKILEDGTIVRLDS